jgi:hypothetical protein
MRKMATLTLASEVRVTGTDGVIGGTGGNELTAASVADWTAHGIVAAEDAVVLTSTTGAVAGTYRIVSVAAAKLTLSPAPGAGSGTFTVQKWPGDFNLPADFGGLEGGFTFDPQVSYPAVKVVNEGVLRQNRQWTVVASVPQFVAVRSKSSVGTDGQRFEACFFPAPDAEYILTYKYYVLPNKLTATAPYPLGGMPIAELILETALGIAEQRVDGPGTHTAAADRLLAVAIDQDKRACTPDFFGYCGDASGQQPEEATRNMTLRVYGAIP